MKKTLRFPRVLFFVSIIAPFVLFSAACNRPTIHEDKKAATPEALQDNKTSRVDIKSYRSAGNNLVEDLYDEAASKNITLKQLEEQIKAVDDSRTDSVAQFENYNDKSEQYYSSANDHMKLIKASLLRQKIKTIITSSLSKYQSSIAAHKNLLKQIAVKNERLEDLHVALKIITSLQMMEEFQTYNLPSTKSLASLSRKLDIVNTRLDTVTRK